jgi:hypothetical protein
MKTTLDLPEALVKQVKLRALHEGQKLKDAVADLLRKGLASSGAPQAPVVTSPRVVKDPETGLPAIICNPKAPASKMTADELIALEQESQTKEDLERSSSCRELLADSRQRGLRAFTLKHGL